MPTHPLRNFEMQNQNEFNFNGAYSRNKLPKIKESIGIHLIALHANNSNITYLDSFRVEHTPKDIKKFIGNKNIIINIYRTEAYNSIMFGYFVLNLLISC